MSSSAVFASALLLVALVGAQSQYPCSFVTGGNCTYLENLANGRCIILDKLCPDRYVPDPVGNCRCMDSPAVGLVATESGGVGDNVACEILPITVTEGTCVDQCQTVVDFSMHSFPATDQLGGSIIQFGNSAGFVFQVTCNSFRIDGPTLLAAIISPYLPSEPIPPFSPPPRAMSPSAVFASALLLVAFVGAQSQYSCSFVTGDNCTYLEDVGGGRCNILSKECPSRYVADPVGTCRCMDTTANGLVATESGDVGANVPCEVQPLNIIDGTCVDQCQTVEDFSMNSFPATDQLGGSIIQFGNSAGFVFQVTCNSFRIDGIVATLESLSNIDVGIIGLLYELADDNTVDQANPTAVFANFQPPPADQDRRNYTILRTQGTGIVKFGRWVFALACQSINCGLVWDGPNVSSVSSNNAEIAYEQSVRTENGVITNFSQGLYFELNGTSIVGF
eukprot:CAMPEP_0184734906 /NCGR_PEP_ID=MMETSP0314-20130426/61614_1 /TAXON_ID=38298 /ORGANISM="Rhodella maculata, Strain CCMP 736" /LENGTH=448 /DNA_ID=CAMNT_0027201923 /DNA_START=113 /DNA_END=1459 /DNA_ORIENTATION=-